MLLNRLLTRTILPLNIGLGKGEILEVEISAGRIWWIARFVISGRRNGISQPSTDKEGCFCLPEKCHFSGGPGNPGR